VDRAPADFYTGLVADLYAPLRSEVPDPEPYARFVERSGQPALELGCGDGDPILDLRERGLDVEGVDSSADMLDRCRVAAAARGLDVVLHHQPMEDLDTGRRYRSIYLAGPTFCLLPDDATAGRALERIAAHLEPGGTVLVPIFEPGPSPPAVLGVAREHVADDGALLRFTPLREARDDRARTQVTDVRYERIGPDGAAEVDDRSWLLHWYPQPVAVALAEAAGLTVASIRSPFGGAAAPDDTTFVLLLTLPG